MSNQMFVNFSQQMTQQGISGEAVIDSHPDEGFVRVKVNWVPAARGAELTRGFADVMSTVLGMMNVSVKIHNE